MSAPHRPIPSRRDAGFSLVEMLVVVALLGVLALIALPRAKGAFEAASLRSARAATVATLNRARLTAIQRNRTARFRASGTQVWVQATPRLVAAAGSTWDTVGVVLDLNNQYGVTFTPADAGISFDSRGIGLSSNSATTITFSKSGRTSTLVISVLGRALQ